MEKLKSSVWSLAAIVCLIAAIVAWILNRADASFVFAALGVLAWFLNLRRDFYEANAERERESHERIEQEES